MYCETCPVRDYCVAYEEAEKEIYHPQIIVRVNSYDMPGCPLLDIVKNYPEGK